MAPWATRNEPVFYFVVDFRYYKKCSRPLKKSNHYRGSDSYRLCANVSPEKRVLILRARIVPISCFPNKVKKYESGPSWRRKDYKDNSKHIQKRLCPSPPPARTRPTILLPPMHWTNGAGSSSSNTAPVVCTRVQKDTIRSSNLSPPVPATPSAPSPGEVFYNSEDQADLEFIVGVEEWRFPAHSFILSKHKITLETLYKTAEQTVDNEQANSTEEGRPLTALRLPLFQPDVFEQMLRFVYTHQVILSSVSSALRLLHLSRTCQLPDLSLQCLSYISSHLTPSKVLMVLSHLLHSRLSNCTDSAFGNHYHENDNVQNELLFHCFQVIDCHGDFILQSDEFDNLDHEVMVEIVKRDSLEVSSEAVVFDAMMRWACRACKKQRKELTSDNKSLVLGKALFLVRYLVMTPEEFLRGPVSQGVLSKEDKEMLFNRISGKTTPSQVPLPEHWLAWNISSKRQNRNLLSVTSPSSDILSSETNVTISPTGSVNKPNTERKKKSMSKKLLNGVGDLVICVIHMLD